MRISIATPTANAEDILNLDVGKDMNIGDLKAVIQEDVHIPANRQLVYYHQTLLEDPAQTLEGIGINDQDVLQVHEIVSVPQGQAARAVSSQQGGQGGGRTRDDAETLRLAALNDPSIMEQMRRFRPELARVIQDQQHFREVWNEVVRRQSEAETEVQRNIARLNNDPTNVETQRKIEAMIQEEAVEENLQYALEWMPEVFARVHMLYIPVEVNNTKVKAFVDSGAQTTIMSPSCAERCGIMRLLDKRFSGIARGVGTASILGRVHKAQIKIGTRFHLCSFTVMEGKDVDLLLGLDMLKRHQACIDLRKGALIISDEEVPFLAEADIPKNEEAFADEPTVEGPGGLQIGGRSGTVLPPSTEQPAPGTGNFQGKGQTVGSSAQAQQPPQQQPQPSVRQQTPLRAPQQRPQGTASFPPAAIAQLMDLGFSREQVLQALLRAEGNVEFAAGFLWERLG